MSGRTERDLEATRRSIENTLAASPVVASYRFLDADTTAAAISALFGSDQFRPDTPYASVNVPPTSFEVELTVLCATDLVQTLNSTPDGAGAVRPWAAGAGVAPWVDLSSGCADGSVAPPPSPADWPAPPWTAPPLAARDAPATVEAFHAAGSPGAACPAIAPADLGEGAGAVATSMTADFILPNRWMVGYDLPWIEAPVPEEYGDWDFAISAQDLDDWSILAGSTDHRAYADGSHLFTWVWDEGGGFSRSVAHVRMPGSPCDYWIQTYLGRSHLEHLIANLRFVEGAP
jgi:hypothetical protein